MLTVERTFDVTTPIAIVFSYLADFGHTEVWDPGTVTTTRTGTGPVARGATWHNVSEFRGRRTELEYELTTFDAPRHLVFTGTNKTVTSADDLTFGEAGGGGTTVRYQARFDFHGVARLAEPFLKKAFDKIADETVVQLRSTLTALVG